MFSFKKGKRKDFKTEEAYLKDIFARNQAKITEVFGNNAETKFINQVQARKRMSNTNVSGALKQLARTNDFTPYTEIAGENVINALKKYGKYQTFRGLTRDEKGRYTKLDRTKLKWDKETGMYIYDNRIAIDIKNSPEEVVLTEIA